MNLSRCLKNRIYDSFDVGKSSQNLGSLCLELLAEQKETWPELRQAYKALDQTAIRELVCDGFSVRLLHNPGRLTSTAASVSETAINERPCFLCEHALPDAQKAILYREEYLILLNPMPVISGHLTIARTTHQPQIVAGNLDSFLHLAADFGSDWTILYNGPRCGASAPDHMHFQAIPAGMTPIEHQIRERERLVPYGLYQKGISCLRVKNVGREVVLLSGKEPELIISALQHHVEALSNIAKSAEEPMINLAAHFEDESYTVLLFPRQKHRPDAFFKDGDDRIMVSPAVVEMAGIVVTPFRKDFDRLYSDIVEDIYREVSLDLDS